MRSILHLTRCALPALLLCGAAPAKAQVGGFQLNRYEPTAAGEWSFMVSRPWYSSTRRFAAGVTLNYAHDPLVFGLRRGDDFTERSVVISHHLVGHVDLALSLWDRVTGTFTLPVTLAERGEAHGGVAPISGAAVGDPRLGLIGRLWGQSDGGPLSVHVGLDLWVPIGATSQHAGDSGARVLPKLMMAGLWRRLSYSGSLGFYYRPDATIGQINDRTGSTLGPALQIGAAIGYADIERRFRVGPELLLHTTVTGGHGFRRDYTNLELLLGAHYNIARVVQTGLALGLGTLRDPGTPDFRLLFRLAYAPLGRPAQRPVAPPTPAPVMPPPVEPPPLPPAPPPQRDPCKDAKVVVRQDHLEVREKVRFDTNSARIRPESDALLRALADTLAQRPAIRVLAIEGHTDSDGDNAFNQRLSEDRAASVRRWLIERGGIAAERLVSRGFGEERPLMSPERGPDDKAQNRRVEFLIVDPDPRRLPQVEGCVCRVVVRSDLLELREQVLFETASARLKEVSLPLLRDIAETLRDHPEIRRISIEGHTDSDGSDTYNLDLSAARAHSVMRWLVEEGGVAKERLEAQGFGERQPKVKPEKSALDKAQNRRVEARIIDRGPATQDVCDEVQSPVQQPPVPQAPVPQPPVQQSPVQQAPVQQLSPAR